jgi:hypothetical protein
MQIHRHHLIGAATAGIRTGGGDADAGILRSARAYLEGDDGHS